MSLDHLTKPQDYRVKRISSYDRTGGNCDFVEIGAGKTVTFAEIAGPAQVTRIWFAPACKDRQYLRRAVLRVY